MKIPGFCINSITPQLKFGLKRLLIVFFVISSFILSGCSKEDAKNLINNPLTNYYIESSVLAALGDILSTADSLNLIIPPGSLSEDGIVFLGRTGNESTVVPKENMQLVGRPLTIRIPSDTILKPLKLSFPLYTSSLDIDNYVIFLYNGTTYFPVEFSVNGNIVNLEIDLVSWERSEEKSTALFSELIVIGFIIKQTPSWEEMGLNKVLINDGVMSYSQPTANSSSKVLLLVHGWTGRPDVWDEFIPKLQDETDLLYTEFWTFGYNSSWSIEENAEILFNAINANANGANIDIVAHSMGGLVSRSMIETFSGDSYIDRLITLGSPHLGSPLAVWRYIISGILSGDEFDEDVSVFNCYSQGFRDLYSESDYIKKMRNLEEPPIPYYSIACTNNPIMGLALYTSMHLEGPDDGAVQVSSAKGVSGATTTNMDVNIPVGIAHMKMTKNDQITEQVIGILSEAN